jgi:ankyrin repeat protein
MDCTNADGNTILYFAAAKGNKDLCQFLIEEGQKREALKFLLNPNSAKQSPLHPLCASYQTDFFSKENDRNSISKYDIPNFGIRNYFFLFFFLTFSGSAKDFSQDEDRTFVLKLIHASGISDINLPDHKGITPIMYACLAGNVKVVETLLTLGAKIHISSNNGCCPLHYAAFHGDSNIVEMLMQKGANVNSIDDKGRTPLHISVLKKHEKSTQKILASGEVILDVKDKQGKTAVSNAVVVGNQHLLEMLFARGFSHDVMDSHGYTLLHHAAYFDRCFMIETLVSKGIGTNKNI